MADNVVFNPRLPDSEAKKLGWEYTWGRPRNDCSAVCTNNIHYCTLPKGHSGIYHAAHFGGAAELGRIWKDGTTDPETVVTWPNGIVPPLCIPNPIPCYGPLASVPSSPTPLPPPPAGATPMPVTRVRSAPGHSALDGVDISNTQDEYDNIPDATAEEMMKLPHIDEHGNLVMLEAMWQPKKTQR